MHPNKNTRRAKLAIFAAFIGSAALASAQTTSALATAAGAAVDDGIASVTPIMAVSLGFAILAGLIYKFCKK